MKLSPIVLFSYKRLDTLKRTIETLSRNHLAQESDLFIFSDAAKGEADRNAVEDVRKYIHRINGFRSVKIYQSYQNKGLANSILAGVGQIFLEHESVIVLEDDLITAPNFLNFMNQGLQMHKTSDRIFSVSGFTTPIVLNNGYNFDVYYTHRAFSWGWATWRDRWNKIDWSLSSELIDNSEKRALLKRGGYDLIPMLKKQAEGKVDSWAVKWCCHQALEGLLSVYPVTSKVINIGFSKKATHTNQRFNRFSTKLDQSDKTVFKFNENHIVNKDFEKQFFAPFSFRKRLIYKMLNLVSK